MARGAAFPLTFGGHAVGPDSRAILLAASAARRHPRGGDGSAMTRLLAVAAGGALGALARYGLTAAVHAAVGRGFPWGTLAANVLGSFAMGLLYVLLLERSAAGPELRALLLTGFLGAFTTFSTFSVETLDLLEAGALGRAAVNVAVSVAACLAAAWLGTGLARQL